MNLIRKQIWAAPSKIVPLSMRKMRWFRSFCACAKYHLVICLPFIHSVVSNDSVSGQQRPWSECADAQADLGLHCPHMPEDTFSLGAAHIDFTSVNWTTFAVLTESWIYNGDTKLSIYAYRPLKNKFVSANSASSVSSHEFSQLSE